MICTLSEVRFMVYSTIYPYIAAFKEFRLSGLPGLGKSDQPRSKSGLRGQRLWVTWALLKIGFPYVPHAGLLKRRPEGDQEF